MTDCFRCENDRQPEHFGSPRNCAFKDGVFTPDNWNCGTMWLLREIPAYDKGDSCEWRINESSLGVIPFVREEVGLYAVLTWYKNRGCTSQAYIMSDDETPRPLTLQDAEDILIDYGE